ncbi:hydrogen peroxide-inducible genes activator [Shimia marina]|uniref:Morphology and auto-aggregation control protein n=1 Tax=Shimia marina TaxID=321267 RepID=A0A0P1ESP5_9RHOB|nr:hydrogen peroxide-inducible genes activator [Shimia marina]CUH52997.1 Morphology and auto-aggregation control protein [Shimia marina]SFD92029.1 transcriptional regulator, LysR family [Shimia marina]
MRPTLRQLEYIVAVADTGQIGLAAAQLNVSQPSLSAQLSEVEADLGAPLFQRGRSGAKITPVGEDVVRRARQILHEHKDLRAAAQGGGIFQGRLRLGVLPSIGPYLLPGVVQRLHREHPHFRLIVREESTRDLDEGLRSGRLDMIISTPEDHPGAQSTHLFTEQLWAALALDHPLRSPQGTLPLNALSGQTLLTLGSGHRLSHIVAGLAASAGGRVSDEYEGTSLDAIRLMAATGAGVAILPSIYAATERRRGTDVRLHLINDPAASRALALVQPNLPQPRPGSDVLADVLQSEAARILAAPDGAISVQN